jgi:hypothetical protein
MMPAAFLLRLIDYNNKCEMHSVIRCTYMEKREDYKRTLSSDGNDDDIPSELMFTLA